MNTPKEIIKLIEGYQQFRQQYIEGNCPDFNALVEFGQKPKILVVACSDSRVDPALVTNCKPGDMFVIRNVANLIPPYEGGDNAYHGTSAALEYGVRFLEIEHIIIFGHTKCGGIATLFQQPIQSDEKSFIGKWMELAKPAHDIVMKNHGDCSLEEKITFCDQYSLINSMANLLTFPWVEEKMRAGTLSLHAWYFDLTAGVIQSFNPDNNCFTELK